MHKIFSVAVAVGCLALTLAAPVSSQARSHAQALSKPHAEKNGKPVAATKVVAKAASAKAGTKASAKAADKASHKTAAGQLGKTAHAAHAKPPTRAEQLLAAKAARKGGARDRAADDDDEDDADNDRQASRRGSAARHASRGVQREARRATALASAAESPIRPRDARGQPSAAALALAARAPAPLPAPARSASVAAAPFTAAAVASAHAGESSRLSFGQQQGLHIGADALELKSSVALVVDQDTNEVLVSKNAGAVLPIASITKLMTGMVVIEARQPLDEVLTITQDDVDTEKNSSSRLKVGSQLTRADMLHLALMSSENRAAHALGRNYPGGLDAAVAAMNRRAASLGMRETRYVEPTGLSSANQSSARDLALLVKEALHLPLMRELTTSPEAQVALGDRLVQFHNTNRLVSNPNWAIGLQKTGYISEAGRCLVMQAQLAGRKLIMVLLDSAGKYSRLGDAERIRKWLDQATADAVAPLGLRPS